MLATIAAMAQPVGTADVARITPYAQYWGLVDAAQSQAGPNDRFTAAVQQAQHEFGGRGPALAQYFLHHIQAQPSNTAFFFLFRAVGDVDTVMQLIPALVEPPAAQGMVLGRDPAEVQIAIEAALWNETVRTSSKIVSALEDTVGRTSARPGYARVAAMAIALLGKCRTAEAARFLQSLTASADPQIRSAALAALPGSGASAEPALARAITSDPDAEVRTRAAETLGRGEPAQSAALLQKALEQEKDPAVIDQTIRALTALHALPQDPAACLRMAARCWDASAAKPLFDCWRVSANREEVITQASSGSWTVRALALEALAGSRSSASLMRQLIPAPAPIDTVSRDRLLRSAVEILSHELSGTPALNTVSYSTAQVARDAFWEISGRNMALALSYADRIAPLSGRYASAGRFGESYDLASKDPSAYAAVRRPQQLLSAALAALSLSLLLPIRRARRIVGALLLAVGAWAVLSLFETGVTELPPPPLGYLTISCLAFLSAGLMTGWITGVRLPAWLRVAGAALLSAISAAVVCAFTRSVSWFPIGSDGWQLIFDPLGCALTAAPFALVLSLVLILWNSAGGLKRT